MYTKWHVKTHQKTLCVLCFYTDVLWECVLLIFHFLIYFQRYMRYNMCVICYIKWIDFPWRKKNTQFFFFLVIFITLFIYFPAGFDQSIKKKRRHSRICFSIYKCLYIDSGYNFLIYIIYAANSNYHTFTYAVHIYNT